MECSFPFLIERVLKREEIMRKIEEAENERNSLLLCMLRKNLKALALKNEKLREKVEKLTLENKWLKTEIQDLKEIIQKKDKEIFRLREDNAILRSLVRKLKSNRKIA